MSTPLLVERAGIVRGFNRFYTHQIGVLQEHLLQSDYSLTEIRVMYELSSRGDLTSADLCQMLSLDAGYLSRLVGGLEKKGLIQKVRSVTDARAVQLHLSDLGRSVLTPLEQQTQQEVIALLQGTPPSYLLRDPQPGDMGLVVQQQSALYAREYQWSWEFEALVAEIVAKYLREFDPTRERCWIAEKDGEVVGSVFVVRHDDSTAKLRMLYVDASARGMGIGQRLVEECVRFARQAGYKSMMLWTVNILTDARKLYQKAGFELVEEEPTVSFGKTLISETWTRDL